MKSWILTGGIACGKTRVAEELMRLLGASCWSFSADEEVTKLMEQPETLQELREAFGEAVIAEREEGGLGVNRAWLRQHVFENATARQRLEGLLHPQVLSALERRRKEAAAAGGELFLAEVPLHYEIGGTVSADLIIVVASSRPVQVRRLMERRGLEEPIIEQMLRSQWPIEAKVEKADVVIWNEGDLAALDAQVLTLARQHWQA